MLLCGGALLVSLGRLPQPANECGRKHAGEIISIDVSTARIPGQLLVFTCQGEAGSSFVFMADLEPGSRGFFGAGFGAIIQ